MESFSTVNLFMYSITYNNIKVKRKIKKTAKSDAISASDFTIFSVFFVASKDFFHTFFILVFGKCAHQGNDDH